MVNGNIVAERMQKGDVLCYGILTYTLLLAVDELPIRNDGAELLESFDSMGDDAAIIACVLSQWGVPARLITTPTGNDSRGESSRQQVEASGVDVDLVVDEDLSTPFEVSIMDPEGGRTYFQRRDDGIAKMKPPGPAALEKAGILYVDWYDGPDHRDSHAERCRRRRSGVSEH